MPPAAIMSSGDRPRWPLGILISGICALPIAYYFISGNWFPPSAPGPQLASVDARTVAPSSQADVRINAQDDAPDNAQENDAERPADNEMASQRAKASRTARLSEREAVALLRPDEKTGTQASPPKETVRPLDPEKSGFSQSKANNSLRQEISSPPGRYSNEPRKPTIRRLQPRWARLTIRPYLPTLVSWGLMRT